MSIGINPQINKNISFSQQDKGKSQRLETQVQTKKNPNDKILKPAVLLSAIAGVTLVVSSIAKRQGINIFKDNHFSNILKPHKWKLNDKEFKPIDIIKIASGSIGGGLIAGMALDKENAAAKLREGFQQIVGNIMIPVGCVTLGIESYKKLNEKYKIEAKLPEIKSSKILTQVIKSAPAVFASLVPLAIGILGGNWLANKLSQEIFDVTDKREIELGDFSGHLDDLCLAAMLINPTSNIGHVAGNLVPIALLVSGFESGTKKKQP
jgi:hypothetical protein